MREIDYGVCYSSARAPVFGRSAIATSHSLASQAGMAMLLDGGNAVDAILAAAMALTVVEPSGNGVGSDAFAIVWDGRQLHGLNSSGRSPAGWTPERFAGREAMGGPPGAQQTAPKVAAGADAGPAVVHAPALPVPVHSKRRPSQHVACISLVAQPRG